MAPLSPSLLRDLEDAWAPSIESLARSRPLGAALLRWLRLVDQTPGRLLAEDAAARLSGAARSPQDVAILGLLAGAHPQEPALVDATREGLGWLRQLRIFAPARPATFEQDAESIFGVAVAVHAYGDEQDRTWARERLCRGALAWADPTSWLHELALGGAAVLGDPADAVLPEIGIALEVAGELPFDPARWAGDRIGLNWAVPAQTDAQTAFRLAAARAMQRIGTSETTKPPQAELVDLLCDIADVPEQRRLVARLPAGVELLRVLPEGAAIGREEYADQLVKTLERRHLLDRDFFCLLAEQREKHLNRIRPLAAHFVKT